MGPNKKAPEHSEDDEAADSQPEDEIAWLTKDIDNGILDDDPYKSLGG